MSDQTCPSCGSQLVHIGRPPGRQYCEQCEQCFLKEELEDQNQEA